MTDIRPRLGDIYRDTRLRLSDLVLSLDAEQLTMRVPACPEWSVSDVVYHLVAGAEDVVAGRLTGPPSDAHTAAQVRRHRGEPIADVVGIWAEVAPSLERRIATGHAWPPVLDLVSHEQDIRGALGQPGGRDSVGVSYGAEALCSRATNLPLSIRLLWEDGEGHMGPDSGHVLELRTTRFDTVRWRLGRRSRAQMARFDWSGDPKAVLDHLALFGPSEKDIIE